jgi:hypothetical protein
MADPKSKTVNKADEAEEPAGPRRTIQGNLPYTTSVGVLKRILEKIPDSEKPTTFNYDFLSTVLGASGGSARQVLPILKKCGIIASEGTPTDLYSEFQTDGGRPNAAVIWPMPVA